MPTQHATLSPERWTAFSLDQQILMIANEMNRAGKWFDPDDPDRRKKAYQRIMNLLDLTVAVSRKRTLRRELLRWRGLIAGLYISGQPDRTGHRAAFRCLLQFTPKASLQLKSLAG